MTAKQWQRLRLAVLKRDGYVCYLCGTDTDPDAGVNEDTYPHADHVLPISMGGETAMDNLRCAHRSCNIAKSNKVGK